MLNKEQLRNSLRVDPRNDLGKRNYHNTPIKAYNCGGFALSVYDWICPYYRTDYEGADENEDSWTYTDENGWIYTDTERDDIMQELANDGYSEEEIENIILIKDINFLLNAYPFLRLTNLEDCTPTDTVIAYRLFIAIDEGGCICDTDFHFKLRINGFWFEKMGDGKITLCQLDEDKPWSAPSAKYTSRIIYFKTDRGYQK